MDYLSELRSGQASPSLRRKTSFASPPPHPQVVPGPNAFNQRQAFQHNAMTTPEVPTIDCSRHKAHAEATRMSPPYHQTGIGKLDRREESNASTVRKLPSSSHRRHQSRSSPSPTSTEQRLLHSSLESKREDRLLELIRNGGTVSTSSQIANIHSRIRAASPSRSVDKGDLSQDPSSSPKKSFLNRLGFGAPTLKPDNASTSPINEPIKLQLTPIGEVPSKAAKLLGAEAMTCRDYTKDTAGKHLSDPQSNKLDQSPHRRKIHSAPSNGSPSASQRKSNGGNETRNTETVDGPAPAYRQEPRLKALNERIASGASENAEGSLKFIDGELPPTPPSKTSAFYHSSHQGQGERALQNASPNKVTQGETMRLGETMHHTSPNVVQGQPHRSVYGIITDEDSTPTHRQRHEGSVQANAQSQSSSFGGMYLPSTTYTPSVYQERWGAVNYSAGNTSHHTGLPNPQSEDLLRLCPSPLHVPPNTREAYHESGSGSKSRNASESTGMSVPVYLESPPADGAVHSANGSREHAGSQHEWSPRSKGTHQSLGSATTIRGPVDQSITMEELSRRLESRIDANFKALEVDVGKRIGRLEDWLASLHKTQTVLWESYESVKETIGSVNVEIGQLRFFANEQSQSLRDVLQYVRGQQQKQYNHHHMDKTMPPSPTRIGQTSPSRLPPAYTNVGGVKTRMPADPADLTEQETSRSQHRGQNPYGQQNPWMPATHNGYFVGPGQFRPEPSIWSHPYYRTSN